MLSPAHGQIIVHGENHGCLFQQKLQVPGQCAFSRAGGSVEQDDAPASRPGRFPVLRRVFFSHGFMVFRTVRGGVPVTVSRPAGSGPFREVLPGRRREGFSCGAAAAAWMPSVMAPWGMLRLFPSITGMPHSCRKPYRPSFASCSGRGWHERVRHGLFPGCSRIYLFPTPACRGYFLQKNVWGLRIVRFGV